MPIPANQKTRWHKRHIYTQELVCYIYEIVSPIRMFTCIKPCEESSNDEEFKRSSGEAQAHEQSRQQGKQVVEKQCPFSEREGTQIINTYRS